MGISTMKYLRLLDAVKEHKELFSIGQNSRLTAFGRVLFIKCVEGTALGRFPAANTLILYRMKVYMPGPFVSLLRWF